MKCNKTRETGIRESRESFVTSSEQKQKRPKSGSLTSIWTWMTSRFPKGKWVMFPNAYKKNKRSKSRHSLVH